MLGAKVCARCFWASVERSGIVVMVLPSSVVAVEVGPVETSLNRRTNLLG
jgi:hypothetical protein